MYKSEQYATIKLCRTFMAETHTNQGSPYTDFIVHPIPFK